MQSIQKSGHKTGHNKRKTACNLLIYKRFPYFNVVRLGLEPRLFCTKNRRVANYTIGQFAIKNYDWGCKTNKYIFKSNINLMFF